MVIVDMVIVLDVSCLRCCGRWKTVGGEGDIFMLEDEKRRDGDKLGDVGVGAEVFSAIL
jgi:hypothetical protein